MRLSKTAAAIGLGLMLALTACGAPAPSTTANTGGGAAPATSASGSGGETSAAPASLEKTELTFGTFASGAVTVYVNVGVDEGNYTAQGLKVDFLQAGATPSDIIPLMANGQIDIAGVGIGPGLNATAGGLDMVLHRLINVNAPGGWELWASKQSGVTKLEELKGKSVGVIGLGGDGDVLVDEALKTVGMSVKDVSLVEVPVPAMIPAMAKGEVDAIWATGQFASALRVDPNAPGTKIVDFYDIPSVKNYAAVGIWTTRDFAEKNPNTLAAFLKAFDETATAVNADDQKARDTLGKMMPQLTPEVLKDMTIYKVEPGNIDAARLQPQVDLMLGAGVVEKADLSSTIWKS